MPSAGFLTMLNQNQREDISSGRADEMYYRDAAREFDPQESINTIARAGVDSVRRDITDILDNVRGEHAAMGRLRSGYGMRDEEDRIIDVFDQRVGERVAMAAPQAAAMKLQNFTNLGAFGSQVRTRGYDLATSAEEIRIAEKAAEQSRRRGIGGALGTLAGIGAGIAFPALAPSLIAAGGSFGAGIADL